MFTFYICVLNTIWTAMHLNSCGRVVGTTADNSVFSERQSISILGSLCSWPPPKTRLRSYYMTLLWTAEIYLKMLPVGRMSKSIPLLPQNDSCKLISGSSTSCLELSGLSVWGGHTGHTCSFLTLKLMDSKGEKWKFSLRKAGFSSSQIMHVASRL